MIEVSGEEAVGWLRKYFPNNKLLVFPNLEGGGGSELRRDFDKHFQPLLVAPYVMNIYWVYSLASYLPQLTKTLGFISFLK